MNLLLVCSLAWLWLMASCEDGIQPVETSEAEEPGPARDTRFIPLLPPIRPLLPPPNAMVALHSGGFGGLGGLALFHRNSLGHHGLFARDASPGDDNKPASSPARVVLFRNPWANVVPPAGYGWPQGDYSGSGVYTPGLPVAAITSYPSPWGYGYPSVETVYQGQGQGYPQESWYHKPGYPSYEVHETPYESYGRGLVQAFLNGRGVVRPFQGWSWVRYSPGAVPSQIVRMTEEADKDEATSRNVEDPEERSMTNTDVYHKEVSIVHEDPFEDPHLDNKVFERGYEYHGGPGYYGGHGYHGGYHGGHGYHGGYFGGYHRGGIGPHHGPYYRSSIPADDVDIRTAASQADGCYGPYYRSSIPTEDHGDFDARTGTIPQFQVDGHYGGLFYRSSIPTDDQGDVDARTGTLPQLVDLLPLGADGTKLSPDANNDSSTRDPGRLFLGPFSDKLIGMGGGLEGHNVKDNADGNLWTGYDSHRYDHQGMDMGYGSVPTTIPVYYQNTEVAPYHRIHTDHGYDLRQFGVDGSAYALKDGTLGVDGKVGLGLV